MTATDVAIRTRRSGSAPLARAAEALKAAHLRLRDDLRSRGWVLIAEPAVWARDHLVVRYAMHRDGVAVSDCGFALGPGASLVFTSAAEQAVTGDFDAMSEADFSRLMETWAGDVQAGIGHRWRYEARKPRARGPSAGAPARVDAGLSGAAA